MNKIAIFPGSFDPITNGHVDIIKRSLPLFDKVIVAIGINSQKKYLFALEDRKSWIQEVFKDEAKVEIDSYTGLTINYCRKVHANYIIRGIRSALDFEYEKTIAHLNNTMQPEIETILILSKAELSSVSSTIVREIITGGGDIGKFIPRSITKFITKDNIDR